LVSFWVYSFSIGFSIVFFFGLGFFLGNRADKEKLKDKEHLIEMLRVIEGDMRESRNLYSLRVEELNKELEDLRTARNECFAADKKTPSVGASDMFRTPKGLLSFKKYVRE
jgi:hypothetical protein